MNYFSWTLSWIFLVLSSFFWAFHDTYFWDGKTAAWVKKIFRDWHYLKDWMLVSFFLSIYFLPRSPLYIIAFWILRWSSFEFFMNYASMSKIYVPNHKWAKFAEPFFVVTSRPAIAAVISICVIVGEYFV